MEQHALEAGRCKGLGDCLSAGRWLILDGQARIVMMINICAAHVYADKSVDYPTPASRDRVLVYNKEVVTWAPMSQW